MNSSQMSHSKKEDVVHRMISDEPEAGSIYVNPNVTAELPSEGAVIGIEILSARAFIRKAMLETVQGRLLELPRAQ